VHANHAREIDGSVRAAIADLRASETTVLNQAVLLRGVNDSVAALVALSETLFAAGVLPYYLHVLDRVAGAAHFDLPVEAAQRLVADVATHLPGYWYRGSCGRSPGHPRRPCCHLRHVRARIPCYSPAAFYGYAASAHRPSRGNDIGRNRRNPLVVLSRQQDPVEIINSTLRSAGHPCIAPGSATSPASRCIGPGGAPADLPVRHRRG